MRFLTLLWLLAVVAIGAAGWSRVTAHQPDTEVQDEQVSQLETDSKLPDQRPAQSQAAKSQPGASTLIASLTVFVLAVFVGFEIITKVPPTLHTPLMSGSNAISGIAVVGALLVAGGSAYGASRTWGFLAVLLATINVVGGFLVTHRMLAMFNKPRNKPS